MSRNINPLLGGELLKTLDEMGHGDRPALGGRNYPAHSSGSTVMQLRGTNCSRQPGQTSVFFTTIPADSDTGSTKIR